MTCPACGGEGVLLGSLGNLAHYRCRNCGAQFSEKVRSQRRRSPHDSRSRGKRNPTKGAYPFAEKKQQYAGYDMAQLHWAAKDAYEAAQAMKGHDPAAENWYMDDYYTLSDMIRRRRAKATGSGTFRDKYQANPRRKKTRKRGRCNPGKRHYVGPLEAPGFRYEGFDVTIRRPHPVFEPEGTWEWVATHKGYTHDSGSGYGSAQEAKKAARLALRKAPKSKSRGRRNPGPSDADVRAAEKIKGVQPWMFDNPEFWAAMKRYKKFHGKYPDKLCKQEVSGVADDESRFLVGMGKAMDTTYKPTDKKSSKYGSAYIHEFGDDLKGEPKEADLPNRACTADGKTIVTYGGRFAVEDWVRR